MLRRCLGGKVAGAVPEAVGAMSQGERHRITRLRSSQLGANQPSRQLLFSLLGLDAPGVSGQKELDLSPKMFRDLNTPAYNNKSLKCHG